MVEEESLPAYNTRTGTYNTLLAYDPRLVAAVAALVVVYLLAGDLFWIEKHEGL